MIVGEHDQITTNVICEHCTVTPKIIEHDRHDQFFLFYNKQITLFLFKNCSGRIGRVAKA